MKVKQSSFFSSSFPSEISNRKKTLLFLDQKAELYSILRTATTLKRQFDSGMLESALYYRNMQRFHQTLSQIDQTVRNQDGNLHELLQQFPIGSNLQPMLVFIKAISDFQYDMIAQKWHIDPFRLAQCATEATSHFITILDYFHLIDYIDLDFIQQLFGNLRSSLSQLNMFQSFVDYLRDLEKEILDVLGNIISPDNNYHIKPDKSDIKHIFHEIEDTMHEFFLDFKHTLSASSTSYSSNGETH